MTLRIFTIGHGRRELEELVACLREAGVESLVDVRRYPGSRRNPQFNQANVSAALAAVGIAYTHTAELGGFRAGEPGEERYACLGQFAGYAARMGTPAWQAALDDVLGLPAPCVMCAETPWQRCHRRLISELLEARGHEVVHLLAPGEHERHRAHKSAEALDGRLYLCEELVA